MLGLFFTPIIKNKKIGTFTVLFLLGKNGDVHHFLRHNHKTKKLG